MVIKDNGDVESNSGKSDCEDMPSLEDCFEDQLALPIEKSLVIKRTLQVQIKEDDSDQQMETSPYTMICTK
jgi:hypothetical protein